MMLKLIYSFIDTLTKKWINWSMMNDDDSNNVDKNDENRNDEKR